MKRWKGSGAMVLLSVLIACFSLGTQVVLPETNPIEVTALDCGPLMSAEVVVIGVVSHIQRRAVSVQRGDGKGGSFSTIVYYDTANLEVEKTLRGTTPPLAVILLPSAGPAANGQAQVNDNPMELVHDRPPHVSEGQRSIWVLEEPNTVSMGYYVVPQQSCVIPMSKRGRVVKCLTSP
jgi:hypothetical protein